MDKTGEKTSIFYGLLKSYNETWELWDTKSSQFFNVLFLKLNTLLASLQRMARCYIDEMFIDPLDVQTLSYPSTSPLR